MLVSHRILNAYVSQKTVVSVLIVLMVISALDLLAQLIEELGELNDNYTVIDALVYVGLYIPSSVYKYMPFAALVGGLIGLGGLAATSELVVMRSAGISLLNITWMVIKPVLWFILVMLLLAEYVIPVADQYAENRRSLLLQGKDTVLNSPEGLWNREGDVFMHVNSVQANGRLYGVTRYHYDDNYRLLKSSFAESAIYIDGIWQEENVKETHFEGNRLYTNDYLVRAWETELTPGLLTILVQDTDNLAISKLYNYAQYLERQNLESDKYWLAYWGKVLQPLVIISLVLVAVSFIFGPLRQVTMGYRIFTGVVVGIVFQLLQKLLGPASLLYGLPPLLAVLLPIVFCLFFGWFLIQRTR